MRRKLLWVCATIIALMMLAGGAALYYADHLAQRAVERAGTRSLGVPTRLGSLHLALLGGTCSLSDLHVANPEGFESAHFLRLDGGEVAISLASLRHEQVVVPRLELSGIDLHLEQRRGRSNYQVIIDHFQQQQQPTPDEAQGRKFIIRELVIRDVSVHFTTLSVTGELTTWTTPPLAEIHLQDVGSDTDGGLLLQELTGTIIQRVLLAVLHNAGQLPQMFVQGLQGGLAELPGAAGVGLEVGEQVLGTGVEQSGRILEGGGRMLEGLGGLLRKREPKEPIEPAEPKQPATISSPSTR